MFTTAADIHRCLHQRQPRFDPFTGRPVNPYKIPPSGLRPTHADNGTSIVYMDGNKPITTTAINELQSGIPKELMQEPTPTIPSDNRPVIGGISVIQTMLNETIVTSTRAIKHFKNKVLEHEETCRIKQARTLPLLCSAADYIADQVNNNRPVSAPVLQSVVRNETEKAISKLKQEVQSLRAQLSNNTAKKKKKNTSKDF